MTQKDLYRILGVSPTARPEQIRSAYRRLLRRYHPDVYRGDPVVAAANCREIVDAYDVLIDPVGRADYDRERLGRAPRAIPTRPPRRRFPTSAPASPTPAPPPPPRVHRAPVQRVVKRPSPPVPPPASRGLWSLHDEERENDRSSDVPRSAGFLPYWRARVLRLRGGYTLSPRMVHVVLVLLAVLFIVIGVAATVPYNHAFALASGTNSSPNGGDFCGEFVEIPAAAQVSFSWRASGTGMTGTSSTPLVEVVGPAGWATEAQVSWVGSGGFVSQGGDYEFGISGCYGVTYYSVQFTGDYSAPLL